MAHTYKVKRTDPYYAFSAAKYDADKLKFIVGKGNPVELTDLYTATFTIFSRHIGLVKYMNDGLDRIKPVIEMRQANRSGLLKPRDKNVDAYNERVRGLKNYILSTAGNIYELYLIIAAHNFIHGGMSIERTFEKAYEIVKPFAETYLNHQMQLFGLSASMEIVDKMEVEASIFGSDEKAAPAVVPPAAPAGDQDNGGGVGLAPAEDDSSEEDVPDPLKDNRPSSSGTGILQRAGAALSNVFGSP